MKVRMLCLEEGIRKTEFQGVKREEYVLSLRDASKEGQRCQNNFRFKPDAETLDKYKGKLRDTFLIVEINEIGTPFNGIFGISGSIALESASNGK
jgi:hypothetical protein